MVMCVLLQRHEWRYEWETWGGVDMKTSPINPLLSAATRKRARPKSAGSVCHQSIVPCRSGLPNIPTPGDIALGHVQGQPIRMTATTWE